MKPCTVYTINRESVTIPEYQPYVERHNMPMPPCVVNMGPDAPTYMETEVEQIPVEKICKSRLKRNPLFGPIEYETETTYIAIEPELKDMFSMEWKQKAERAESEWRQKAEQAESKLSEERRLHETTEALIMSEMLGMWSRRDVGIGIAVALIVGFMIGATVGGQL